MHEQKGFVIAAVLSVLCFTGSAQAQKDAAEKAKEGGIDHWIEYYKGEQRKPTPPSGPQPVQASDARTPGVGSLPDKTERK